MKRIFVVCLLAILTCTCERVIAEKLVLGVPANMGPSTDYYTDALIEQVEKHKKVLRIVPVPFGSVRELIGAFSAQEIALSLLPLDTIPYLRDGTVNSGERIATFLTQPLTFKSQKELAEFQESFVGETALAQLNLDDLVAVGYWNAGMSVMGSTKKIASVQDLEGTKIRPLAMPSKQSV